MTVREQKTQTSALRPVRTDAVGNRLATVRALPRRAAADLRGRRYVAYWASTRSRPPAMQVRGVDRGTEGKGDETAWLDLTPRRLAANENATTGGCVAANLAMAAGRSVRQRGGLREGRT